MKIGGWLIGGVLLMAAGTTFFYAPLAAQQESRLTFFESHGIRFTIPLGYEQRDSKNRNVVLFQPQKKLQTLAIVKFYFEHRPNSAPGSELTPQKMDEFGLTKTGERQMTMAGRDGGCVEYSVRTKSRAELVQAECTFGAELHSSFFGEPRNLNYFYGFIRAAEPAEKGGL